MTTYIVTINGDARVLDDDHAHDAVAEFFAKAQDLRDGSDISVRKADYMDRIHDDYDAAVTYINAAGDQLERRRRKREVFHVIYAGPQLVVHGTTTGRFTTHHPPISS